MEKRELSNVKPLKNIIYPLDKLNSVFWGNIELQTEYQTNVGSTRDQRKGKEITINFSINFDDIEQNPDVKITRHLTPFDKAVYIAVSNLYEHYDFISMNQIHHCMGASTNAGTDAIKRIQESIVKMSNADIYIDNRMEIENYPQYMDCRYTGKLLPVEFISAKINGQMVKQAIHPLREPPLFSYAKGHEQITTISSEVLMGRNLSSGNLCIDDYLIRRIASMKHGKNHTILLDTLFEQCDIQQSKPKQRALKKIEKILERYKSAQFIKDYKREKERLFIYI